MPTKTETYELRLFDDTLLTFSMENIPEKGFCATPVYVNEKYREMLPLDLRLSDSGMASWLQNRILPSRRMYSEIILNAADLLAGDIKGIVKKSMCLSLIDSYWIVPCGYSGSYRDVNLFENPYTESISRTALTGIIERSSEFVSSPELTTNGALPKCWLSDPKGLCLYKGGSIGFANSGMEPYSEFYAFQIAEAMGLAAVPYDIEYQQGILTSKCHLFTDMETAYVPVGRIVRSGGLKAVMEYYATLGKSFVNDIRSMLVFDAVICNEDRHFGNFGVLRDNVTGVILSAAPIFDNGLSLFNFAMEIDIENLDEYVKTRRPAYNSLRFEDICAEVAGQEQAAQLARLEGFQFTRHPFFNLPDERLAAIEKQIARRIEHFQLLAMGNGAYS